VDEGRLDILTIAAHRDDVEITCGGTLIKAVDMGKKVGVLDLTRGEMGSKGTAEEREKESLAAAGIMGLSWRGNLGLPDAAVQVSMENKLKVVRIIRVFRPEVVFLPFWEQRHPDHLAAYRLGYDACYLAGLKKLEVDSQSHRPRKIIYVSSFREIKHSFFVDISKQMSRKLDAVAAYKSQFDGTPEAREIFKPGVDIFEFMTTTARHYGHLVGVEYAEAFAIRENILIDNPFDMAVRSI
jgi:bacillithiol biosynthesis deacetylase BshB1